MTDIVVRMLHQLPRPHQDSRHRGGIRGITRTMQAITRFKIDGGERLACLGVSRTCESPQVFSRAMA
ncbi:hypothetical protein FHR87_003577 [Azomonas macrocytogenes]|uniref:Uncharacterized protein n=1 Tax=Azomonas macrocytogenes TaxID=69962 RepID=A0A839TC17_AZOMA|nr:hypothetical protein [Azomonas macrocytogenes]